MLATSQPVWIDESRKIFANGEKLYVVRDERSVRLVEERVPIFLVIWFSFWCGVVLMAAIAGGVTFATRPDVFEPVELSAAERAAPALIQTLPPTTITLQILPREEFYRRASEPTVLGFAQPGLSPCTISIPEGWEVQFSPGARYARWRNDNNGNTLAHEMLHCVRGHWHGK